MNEGRDARTSWDRDRSIEAFLADLRDNRGIATEHLPRYRALTNALLDHQGGALDQIGPEDIQAFVARDPDATPVQARAAHTAATAILASMVDAAGIALSVIALAAAFGGVIDRKRDALGV